MLQQIRRCQARRSSTEFAQRWIVREANRISKRRCVWQVDIRLSAELFRTLSPPASKLQKGAFLFLPTVTCTLEPSRASAEAYALGSQSQGTTAGAGSMRTEAMRRTRTPDLGSRCRGGGVDWQLPLSVPTDHLSPKAVRIFEPSIPLTGTVPCAASITNA